MKAPSVFVFCLLSGCFAGAVAGDPESGRLSVYGPQFEGRRTASGEIYHSKAVTAAHESLPFGTIVRVANFRSGEMVDIRINDRKARDGRVLTISEEAAKKLEIRSGEQAEASYVVVGRVPQARAPVSTTNDQRVEGIHRIGLFGGTRNIGQSNSVPPSSYPSSSYQAAPNTASSQQSYEPAEPPKKEGFSLSGLFGGKKPGFGASPPPAAYPQTPYPDYTPSQPANEQTLVPLNAVAPAIPPGPEVMARQQPASVLPGQPAALPYRAQFGAFRRSSNAYEMSRALNQSGIANTVTQSPATQLFLVVSNAGFGSAVEAQQWIDGEAMRRGWSERPVVIR